MKIDNSKFWAAMLLAAFRFSFVFMPIRINNIIRDGNEKEMNEITNERRTKRFRFYMTIFYAFGTGVMLYTVLIFLISEVHERIISAHPDEAIEKSCSTAQFMISVGFFAMYFVDDIFNWVVVRIPSIPSRYTRDISSVNRSKELISSISETSKRLQDKNMLTSNSVVTIDSKQLASIICNQASVALHAFFEGVAIGLQCREDIKVWILTTAIMIHSATTLFCISLNFIIVGASKKIIIVHFLIQASVSVFGIVTGYYITWVGDFELNDRRILNGIVEGFSAGTILYIVFFEALAREKKMRTMKLWRSISLIVGFVAMFAAVALISIQNPELNDIAM
ncbi:hypothetical protein HHI36_018320 [Cryptolaemus montrouzieri]|uniref:Uncharacterized protein n=1 Tax=Cryptolaemus montrouzieri TaxID=559131 RepID=A0ABD2NZI6_9CUCU